jgi:intracellular sulfur oxidation DsrE/DsrF family protein
MSSPDRSSPSKSVVIVFKSDGMGATAPEAQPLRETLARKFLALIHDARTLPAAICFYTDGVKLVCEGSPVLAELAALEAQGVHLVICKTCLDYLGLADRVVMGIVGGMPDIITAMWGADTVITL